MSIIQVALGPAWSESHEATAGVNGPSLESGITNAIHDAVWENIRLLDDVVPGEDGEHLIVLCPETELASAETLAARLRQAVRASIGYEIAVGVATFPSDAIAFDDLVEIASLRANSPKRERVDDSEPAWTEQALYSTADGAITPERPLHQDRHA